MSRARGFLRSDMGKDNDEIQNADCKKCGRNHNSDRLLQGHHQGNDGSTQTDKADEYDSYERPQLAVRALRLLRELTT